MDQIATLQNPSRRRENYVEIQGALCEQEWRSFLRDVFALAESVSYDAVWAEKGKPYWCWCPLLDDLRTVIFEFQPLLSN